MQGDTTKASNQSGPVISDQGFDVTEADHEAGFKDVPCETRSGKPIPLRIKALSHRVATPLLAEIGEKGNPWLVFYHAVDGGEALADKLTTTSAAGALGVAWELAYGVGIQKKMQVMGTQMLSAVEAQMERKAAERSSRLSRWGGRLGKWLRFRSRG